MKNKNINDSNKDYIITVILVSILIAICESIFHLFKNDNIFFTIFIYIVIVMITYLAVCKITNALKNEKLKLKEKGILVKAKYTDIKVSNRVYLGGRRRVLHSHKQYSILCQGINPINGKMMTFKSDEFWYNPKEYIDKNNIKEINVYVAKKFPIIYYVDVGLIVYENEKIHKRYLS